MRRLWRYVEPQFDRFLESNGKRTGEVLRRSKVVSKIGDNDERNLESNVKHVTLVSSNEDMSSIVVKINDIEQKMLNGKVVLVGDDGIPVGPVNVDGKEYAKHSSEVSSKTCNVSIGN
ncbi:hypothetical protein Tco_0304279 [Tanacetum coccineum]